MSSAKRVMPRETQTLGPLGGEGEAANSDSQRAAARSTVDPEYIREQHRLVYRRIQDQKERGQDPELGARAVIQFDELLPLFRRLTAEALQKGDWTECDWLETAINDWQHLLSSQLSQRDLKAEIGYPAAVPVTTAAKRRNPVPYSEIRRDLAVMAYFLGQKRKIRTVTERLKELRGIEEDPGRVHTVMISSQASQDEDWRMALVYFAADVLSGRTNFVDQLEDESWRELADVRLEDVKRLNAYHLSLTDSRGLNPYQCYMEACQGLNAKLLDPRVKSPRSDFGPVREFLKAEYGCGESFPTSSTGTPPVEALKARKARILYERRVGRGEPGPDSGDWKRACDYLALFYGHVISAVEGREENMKQALAAFQAPWRDSGLVNCFETAIAIYFFPPDVIRACCAEPDKIL